MMEPELCDSLRKRSLPPAAFTLFPERSQEAPLTPRKRVSDTQAENPHPNYCVHAESPSRISSPASLIQEAVLVGKEFI